MWTWPVQQRQYAMLEWGIYNWHFLNELITFLSIFLVALHHTSNSAVVTVAFLVQFSRQCWERETGLISNVVLVKRNILKMDPFCCNVMQLIRCQLTGIQILMCWAFSSQLCLSCCDKPVMTQTCLSRSFSSQTISGSFWESLCYLMSCDVFGRRVGVTGSDSFIHSIICSFICIPIYRQTITHT